MYTTWRKNKLTPGLIDPVATLHFSVEAMNGQGISSNRIRNFHIE
jgi:hypothetical protein